MATDERTEEQAFLADLEVRTGRDLGQWMAAITALGFRDKNEIIDWLRSQGIPFARASWLERIHNNGGKPIYAGHLGKPEQSQPSPALSAAEQVQKSSPVAQRATAPSHNSEALERLIAASKGYRPLYHLLERELQSAISGLSLAPRAGYISLAAPREFGALVLTSSELRLGLDLGDRSFDARLQKAKLKGAGPGISHMIVLTDARQVNADLIELARSANARVNG
jgi:hypothetical protein